MSFPTSECLRKATGRAKSDVANKLVSMFLHDLSRKIVATTRLAVTDVKYANDVEAAFGDRCCYCSRHLEADRVAIEHLEGMNRFRLGLHIPGNVLLACKRCNAEKRRDDQLGHLALAASGWESFLSHDSSRCGSACKSCEYWRQIWPNANARGQQMTDARDRIVAFRSRYSESLRWTGGASGSLRPVVDSLYRNCQKFATDEIKKTVEGAFAELQAGIGASASSDDDTVAQHL